MLPNLTSRRQALEAERRRKDRLSRVKSSLSTNRCKPNNHALRLIKRSASQHRGKGSVRHRQSWCDRPKTPQKKFGRNGLKVAPTLREAGVTSRASAFEHQLRSENRLRRRGTSSKAHGGASGRGTAYRRKPAQTRGNNPSSLTKAVAQAREMARKEEKRARSRRNTRSAKKLPSRYAAPRSKAGSTWTDKGWNMSSSAANENRVNSSSMAEKRARSAPSRERRSGLRNQDRSQHRKAPTEKRRNHRPPLQPQNGRTNSKSLRSQAPAKSDKSNTDLGSTTRLTGVDLSATVRAGFQPAELGFDNESEEDELDERITSDDMSGGLGTIDTELLKQNREIDMETPGGMWGDGVGLDLSTILECSETQSVASFVSPASQRLSQVEGTNRLSTQLFTSAVIHESEGEYDLSDEDSQLEAVDEGLAAAGIVAGDDQDIYSDDSEFDDDEKDDEDVKLQEAEETEAEETLQGDTDLDSSKTIPVSEAVPRGGAAQSHAKHEDEYSDDEDDSDAEVDVTRSGMEMSPEQLAGGWRIFHRDGDEDLDEVHELQVEDQDADESVVCTLGESFDVCALRTGEASAAEEELDAAPASSPTANNEGGIGCGDNGDDDEDKEEEHLATDWASQIAAETLTRLTDTALDKLRQPEASTASPSTEKMDLGRMVQCVETTVGVRHAADAFKQLLDTLNPKGLDLRRPSVRRAEYLASDPAATVSQAEAPVDEVGSCDDTYEEDDYESDSDAEPDAADEDEGVEEEPEEKPTSLVDISAIGSSVALEDSVYSMDPDQLMSESQSFEPETCDDSQSLQELAQLLRGAGLQDEIRAHLLEKL